MNTVLYIRVPKNTENFYASLTTISTPKRLCSMALVNSLRVPARQP